MSHESASGKSADLDRLLEQTSRTFALSIPLLPEPTRREVTVAYLLFRIADTFEDASSWPRALRIAALERFIQLLEAPDEEEIATGQAQARSPFDEEEGAFDFEEAVFGSVDEPKRRGEG